MNIRIYVLVSAALLMVLEGVMALPTMDIVLVDPEDDVFMTNATTPDRFIPGEHVNGTPGLDVIRAGSTRQETRLLLFMELKGNVSANATYYFMVRTTGEGGIWGSYDMVVEFTNVSATIYFPTSTSYQNLSESASFNMNGSIVRKERELYAYVQLDLLRDPPGFDLVALALLQKDNTTVYADWTMNAERPSDSGPEMEVWLWPVVGIGFFLLFLLFLMKGDKGDLAKDRMRCPSCKRRLTRGLIFCPYCGKDFDRKKR